MGEAIVGPLLNKLQELVLREVTALAGVGNDIRILRDNLMWLHAFAHETDLRSRHDGSHLIRVLARQTREVAFEAEDAIDHFLLQADLSRFNPDWVRAVVGFFANFSTQILVRHGLSRKVADLNGRLERIIGNSARFRVEHIQATGSLGPWRPSPGAAIPAGHLYWDDLRGYILIGRKDEKQNLENFLLKEDDHQEDTICIVGESGVGKTALVRDVYEKREVRLKFVVRVWASFPPDTSDSMMVQLIYEKLYLECFLQDVEPHRPYTDYKSKVVQALESTFYLLVIDSPIDNTKWNKVGPNLPRGGSGSKIVLLVTSWPPEINTVQKLNRLGQEDSKSLFVNSVAIKEDIQIKLEDYTHVQEITRGLPLYVVLLAKLLKTKEYDQWEHVFKYIKRPNEQANRFWMILSLSFDDLSDDLKSCLLYFAGFPENTVVNAHQLIRLWVAEGFLSTKKGMVEMEKLGQQYLKELISRALVRLLKKDVHGSVELVAIHDQIHTFLRLEAQHTCFMEVHYSSFADAQANVRRLFLHDYNDKFATLTNRLSTLRSVLSYSKEDCTQDQAQAMGGKAKPIVPYATVEPNNSLRRNRFTILGFTQQLSGRTYSGSSGPWAESSMKHSCLDIIQLLKGSPFLCVINLEGLDIGYCLPKEIGNMVHLHYLGVRGCRSLKEVSESIGRLTNLQTFDVRGTDIGELPNSLWNIKSLRHVLGDGLRFPTSAGDLELLQTLETVSVRDVTDMFAAILKTMVRLHSLHLIGLDESHTQALRYALSKLTLLVRLRLSGPRIRIDFTSHCLHRLEYMEIDGKLDIGRCDTNRLVNLTHLVLKWTHVNQDFIDKLASLPGLANLELLNQSYYGEVLVFRPDGFKSLRFLSVSTQLRLRKITVINMWALRNIVSLELIGCLEICAPDDHMIHEKIKWARGDP